MPGEDEMRRARRTSGGRLPASLYRQLLERYTAVSLRVGFLFIGLYLLLVVHTDIDAWSPLLLTVLAMSLIGVAYWLNRHGHSRVAAYLYYITIFASLFGVMTIVGGPFSLLDLTLLINLSVLVLLEGRMGAFVGSVLIAAGMVPLIYAMQRGLIHPYIFDVRKGLLGNLFALVTDIGLELYILLEFSRLVEQSVRDARLRQEALEAARARAEATARAERELREREAAHKRHLQEIADTYVAFLERLSTGDFSVHLELPDQQSDDDDPLLRLGAYLNVAAESWAYALRRARQARDRYLATAWSRFLEEQGWQDTTFRLGEEHVERVEGEALPGAAVDDVVVQGGDLLLPLRQGPLSLGTLLLRRGEERPWQQEEIETLRAILAPLVQTLDNLRLMEESRRQAAREQLSSHIADKMRESLDLDVVLRTAARELGEAFGLQEVVVQLTPPNEGGGA